MNMQKKSLFITIMLALTSGTAMAEEKQPAFPGAEGYGRYVTGGRGGNVYHVTNLNDSGEGSLRWAIEQKGTRTIIFDVSGTIHLQSELAINKGNVTIAGQTAPGDGICIADYPCKINANNVIVRYMRFRLGNKNVLVNGADGWDGFGGFDNQDWMIDHCSVSWSVDECLSVLGNKNTTVQWCISSHSLVNSGHSKGAHGYGGNWGGDHASFHHNLMIHHVSRTPRLGPRPVTQLSEHMDMRNNVIYNWAGNGCYGGEGMNVNIVNNYYKPGPATKNRSTTIQKRIASIGTRTYEYITNYPTYAPALHLWGKLFVEGNVNASYSDVTKDNWTYGIYNQINANSNDGTYTQATKDSIHITKPLDFIYTTTHSAETAYQRVLDYVGCSLHRDSYDAELVSDAREGKASHKGSGLDDGQINSQEDLKPDNAPADWSAWPKLNSTAAPKDTDGDGMPDEWEKANGLNPNDANDGAAVTSDGYTNLEHYLNSIVAEITAAQNAGGTVMGNVENVSTEEKHEYEISQQTSNGDWTFGTNSEIKISESSTPAYTGSFYLKYSRNHTYNITIPEGESVSKVKIDGYLNGDTGYGYLQTLGNKKFCEKNGPSDYIFYDRKGGVISTYEITFETPVKGTMPLTVTGDNQCALRLVIYTATSTGIRDIMATTPSNVIYNLQGQRVPASYKGITVVNGKKVMKK